MSNDDYLVPLKTLGRSPAEIAADHPAKSEADKNAIIARALMLEPYINYADVLLEVARNTPPEGFDEGELKRAVAVMGAIEAAVTQQLKAVVLSAPLHAWLVGRLAAFRWRTPHRHVLEFVTDVREAPHAMPREVEA